MSVLSKTKTENALTVENLNIAAGSGTLVHDFSVTIAAGERVGLIGESGSGKSITAMSIMGLLSDGLSATGTIKLAGQSSNLLQANESQLSRIRGGAMSMVFQEPMTALNPLMRVGRQVAEVLQLHGKITAAQAKSRAIELLADVQLPDPPQTAMAYPHQLSGGQRQRVMLAIALANNPALLICDEPTTALDVTVQQQVLDLIDKSVQERGTGLLFITHDLAVVASVCSRVLVMNQGRVVEQGPIAQVFRDPQHPYTRGLLAASDLTATDEDGRLFTVATAKAYRPTATATVRSWKDRATDSEPTDREPVVVVKDLHRHYTRARSSMFKKPDGVHALRGINLQINAGARFGIVGESGSGKSTLLRILAALDQPTSGSVTVGGGEVAGASEKQLQQIRRQLQIVFQDPMGSLDPRMRVGEVIAEPLLNSANLQDEASVAPTARRELVAQMLTKVGLPTDAAKRFPHQFSGGQRQRISIARALITRPRVLIADEAVSALDVSVRAQVLNLLADLVDDYQLTLIFVSHDLSVVRYLCDEVAVMNRGSIVESGSTEQIYSDPQDPYTQSLVAATPMLGSILKKGI